MKNVKILMLTMVLGGLIAIPSVFAQEEQGPEHAMKHKGEHGELFKQLNLTEDQKKQLKANKEKQKEQMKAAFTQMKAQKDAMHQELMKKDLDMAKINAIQSQIKAFQAQMVDNHLNSILEVRKILTPEQFSKFISLMEERKSKWQGHGAMKHGSQGHEHEEDMPSKDEKSK